MTTLKEFEDALREQGMHMALAILQKLRDRDRTKRSVAPARRIAGRKMTPELARRILELHATTEMTQQEIAFQLGVNQGRVNEVIKRGKWLDDNPAAPEAVARDKAKARMADPSARKRAEKRDVRASASPDKRRPNPKTGSPAQLLLGDL
ncbi:sigma factor-like helix-turn-helix DNA-binding protein [Microvirga arabica]|uniref:Sigma factor-like helix-turn-helix DNA-binding protein n=1 Tax=Microvirga arabica TaxID=1128671 RepID=A0ABV6YCL0_9HYPH